MQTIETSCPHCQSRFKLSQEQISLAQGQVRCGTCFEIFQAIPVAEPAGAALTDDDERFADADDELPPISPNLSQNFDEITPQADDFGAMESESKDSTADESWAEALLADLSTETPTTTVKKTEEPESTASLSEQLGDLDNLEINVDLSVNQNNVVDSLVATKQDFAGRIEPAPVEFVYEKPRKWLWSLVFFILNLIMIGLIAGQVLYFQFDQLSHQANLKPIYSLLCGHIDCPKEDNNDFNLISANHTTIQPHPHYKNILIVNAVLTNHAERQQPFPAVNIIFTDNKQKAIAARELQPNEYIKGELANKYWMPSKQPIHIAIEVADTGNEAVGFYIELTQANQSGEIIQ